MKLRFSTGTVISYLALASPYPKCHRYSIGGRSQSRLAVMQRLIRACVRSISDLDFAEQGVGAAQPLYFDHALRLSQE